MLGLETKNRVSNWINKLQDKYLEIKEEKKRKSDEYWKIFDSTVELLNYEEERE